MRSHYYILEGHTAVKVDDVLTWGKWFETADRVVEHEFVDNVHISTVFLGLDHAWMDDEPLELFETMVFGGKLDGEQTRCTTWEQAEAMHAAAVARVRMVLW